MSIRLLRLSKAVVLILGPLKVKNITTNFKSIKTGGFLIPIRVDLKEYKTLPM